LKKDISFLKTLVSKGLLILLLLIQRTAELTFSISRPQKEIQLSKEKM